MNAYGQLMRIWFLFCRRSVLRSSHGSLLLLLASGSAFALSGYCHSIFISDGQIVSNGYRSTPALPWFHLLTPTY
jgi:hypothetical protein